MPGFLRQATASQSRALGPFIDSTDFITPETGLTIANTDIKLIVNGAASADKNSGGGTHRANGIYGVTFDATDTATVGEMSVSVLVSGALIVFDKFFVIEEAVYDAHYAASATGVSAVGALEATAQSIKTKTDFLPSATAGAAGGVFIAGSNAATSITTALTANITGNLSGSVGSVTGAVGSVTGLTASDVGAIKTKTDQLTFTTANKVDSRQDMTQAVATSNTANTVGDCLNAARADGFGKMIETPGTPGSMDLYAPDGTTVIRTFVIDNTSTPTSRT